jgi:hypothetical protein
MAPFVCFDFPDHHPNEDTVSMRRNSAASARDRVDSAGVLADHEFSSQM